jgi:hypothetical protein
VNWDDLRILKAVQNQRSYAKASATLEKIVGKEFTTLAHMELMRELCRDEQGH